MPLGTWTLDQVFNQLNSGNKWGNLTITFSFPTSSNSITTNSGEAPGFSAMNAAQQNASRLAFWLWDDLIAPDFLEVAAGQNFSSTDLELAITTSVELGAGWARFPNNGSIWFSGTYDPVVNPKVGGYGFKTYMHEIGHAIGLEHMGDYNGSVNVVPNSYQDSQIYSIMSYFGPNMGRGSANDVAWADWTGKDGVTYSPQTPMLYDIYAIQRIYGVETTTRTGDTVYGYNSNITGTLGAIFDFTRNANPILTIFDSAGNDTLDLSGWSDGVIIDIAPGAFSSGNGMTSNICIAFSCDIENAVGGAGADQISGNALGNVLSGGAGVDRLFGLAGNDILIGGIGADILDGGTGLDLAGYRYATSGVVVDLVATGNNTGEAVGDVLIAIEGIEGSAFADSLWGDAAGNALVGNAGDDLLVGRDGSDTLDGGTGIDWLYGGNGDDVLIGGAGADILLGEAGTDVASYRTAAAGLVVNLAAMNNNTGDAVGDSYFGIEGVAGSAFGDVLSGDADANSLWGEGGDDELNGAAGNDRLFGGSGKDLLTGGLGSDTLDGGGDVDVASYRNATSGVIVDLVANGNNTGEAAGDQFVAIEGIEGSAFADSLWGDAAANFIYGNAGDDLMAGRDGDDSLNGGSGNDWLYGGNGDDLLIGGAGADTLIGEGGFDTVSYEDAASAVVVDLIAGGSNSGEAAGDRLFGIEGVIGTSSGDSLWGDAAGNRMIGNGGDDLLVGRDGDDILDGGDGNDWLYGGNGNDFLVGGAGADTFVGDAGTDMVSYGSATTGLVIDLVLGSENTGVAAGDRFFGIEILAGTNYADSLRGDGGANTLAGGRGDDWVYGRGGNDIIFGEDGEDTLYGNEGDDTLVGGIGNDLLLGGTGADWLYGEDGIDTASYRDATAGVTVDLLAAGNNAGEALGDRLIGIEVIDGSSFGDSIWGDSLANTILGNGGDDLLAGRDGDDVLTGGAGNDWLYGGNGDDILTGGTGADTFIGEAGADTVTYAGSTTGLVVDMVLGNENTGEAAGDRFFTVERIIGTSYADSLRGDGNANIIYAGSGDDWIYGRGGNDYLYGEAGNDVLYGNEGVDFLYGGDGADMLVGGTDWDILYGDAGKDSLYGNEGADYLLGGDDDDLLMGGEGADFLYGEGGFDTISYREAVAGVTVDLSNSSLNTGEAAGDTISSVEAIDGSGFADLLSGDNNNNSIAGNGGNDILFGRGGIDTLLGGEGSDTLDGGTGNDLLYGGAGDDILTGGAGADLLNGDVGFDTASYRQAASGVTVNLTTQSKNTGEALGDSLLGIEGIAGSSYDDDLTGDSAANSLWGEGGDDVLVGGGGADLLDGGADFDVVSYIGFGSGIVVDLVATGNNTGDAAGDRFIAIEGIKGTNFADSLWGDANANSLFGAEGDDILAGRGGDDLLFGDAGNDWLYGGAGNDWLIGGAGADTLLGEDGIDGVAYDDASAGLVIDLVLWNENTGIAAGDRYYGIEVILASAYGDSLRGDGNANVIFAGSGDDWIYGRGGDDFLYGDAGNDTIYGNEGNDTLNGGSGSDRFIFGVGDGQDTIADFTRGTDTIVLSSGLGVSSFTQVLTKATQASNGVLITFNTGTTLTLTGITLSTLSERDFSFSSSSIATAALTVAMSAAVPTPAADPQFGDGFSSFDWDNGGIASLSEGIAVSQRLSTSDRIDAEISPVSAAANYEFGDGPSIDVNVFDNPIAPIMGLHFNSEASYMGGVTYEDISYPSGLIPLNVHQATFIQ